MVKGARQSTEVKGARQDTKEKSVRQARVAKKAFESGETLRKIKRADSKESARSQAGETGKLQKPRGKTRKSLATVRSEEVAARARGMDKGAESATKKVLKKRGPFP